MIRTLTLATDLLVQRGTTLTPKEGYSVLRTPDEPTFWFGNALVLHDAPTATESGPLIDLARLEFPEAEHVCIQWDVPDLKLPSPLTADFTRLGFEVDLSDALVLAGPLSTGDLPEPFVIRALTSDEDWLKALDLGTEIGAEEGFDHVAHRDYLKTQLAAQRDRVNGGHGAWFGAFDGPVLVAQMGIFHDATLARFQMVETRASHRRRGICSALLGHAGRWALDRAPEAKLVIVAMADSAAGRLYRRAGFALAERTTSAVRGSYASGLSAAVT